MKLRDIVVLCTILISSQTTLASEDIDIATALDWQAKWERVTNSSISSYVERTNKSKMAGLNYNQKKLASKEVEDNLTLKLSWINTGDEFTKIMSSSCKKSTLINLVNIKNGALPQGINRNEVVSEYKSCMMAGFKKIMPILTNVIISFKEDKDAIIEKYRNS
jgi:hypothetical protein